MLRQLIQGAAIAESAAGLIPHRMNFPDDAKASFQLGRSEQLVWLFDAAECRVRSPLPERPASIAKAAASGRTRPYYPPQLFAGRDVPAKDTEFVAPGQLAVTNQRLLFRGTGLDIQLPYEAVRHWEPYCDGVGAVRWGRPDDLVVFRIGDGWFIYNLICNLAAL